MDKLELVKPQVEGLAHAQGSAEWLARRGYPELGPAIIGHPVTRLADAAWFGEWFRTASPEALIVAYADKRAGQRLEPTADRFASWQRRYPPAERAARDRGVWTAATFEDVRARAAELEQRVCGLAAVAPGEVRRLAWTGRAIALARAAGAGGTGAPPGTGAASAVAAAAGAR